jgi:hypothetical protein
MKVRESESIFSTARPVVLGDHAYVAIPALESQVKTYDISDPSNSG